MPTPVPSTDPRPVAPIRPGSDECCGGGCDPCIFELHEEALERYRAELKAWEARHAGSDNKT